MGAIENLSMELRDASERIAGAISELAQAVTSTQKWAGCINRGDTPWCSWEAAHLKGVRAVPVPAIAPPCTALARLRTIVTFRDIGGSHGKI